VEWVGLTDEEINSVRYKRDWTAPWTDTTFARAIEAKLKEKNMSDSYDDYEAKIQLAEHEWEMVKTEHDKQIEIAQAYERGWNAALAQQEPVAWMHTTGTGHVYFRKKPQDKVFNPQPVYTAPSKQWVGLTADEIWKCNKAKSGSAVEFHICYAHQNLEDFAESIEAKLKEKNT
jgi:hypothetical protein